MPLPSIITCNIQGNIQMATFPKFLSATIISLVISTGSLIAMEEEITHTLMVCDTAQIARYCTSGYHSLCNVPRNLPSTIKDPMIQCILTNIETNKQFIPIIAAKYFFKSKSTEHLLKLEFDLGKKTNPVDPAENKLNITACCIKNPNLNGDNFLTQLTNAMIPLYNLSNSDVVQVYSPKDGISFSFETDQDFVHADVLCRKVKDRNLIWVHGPNGCPNEEALIKSINQ